MKAKKENKLGSTTDGEGNDLNGVKEKACVNDKI